MIKIISRVTNSTKGNIINIRAKIAVDSAADLAANLNNYYFALGSLAWDVSTGDIYGIDSSGTWHKQNQSVIDAIETILSDDEA